MSDVPPRPRIRPATSDDWDSSDRSGRSPQPGSQGADAHSADAEFDGSTYYEYIERHTGDLPLSRTRRANVFAPAGSSPFQDHVNAAASGARARSVGHAAGYARHSGAPSQGAGVGSDSGGAGAFGPGGSGAGDSRAGDSGAAGSGAAGYGPGGYGPGGYGPRGYSSGGYGPGGPNSGIGQAVSDSGPRKGSVTKVVIVIAAILAVLALLGYFGARWLAPESATVPVDVGGEESASAAPTPSDELVQPTGTPEEELDGFVKSGTEAAAGLEGQWVTQVSAKKVGLEADGKTWSAQDILDEFKANQVKYPGSILIYSGDWSAYKSGDYWVTVVDTGYSDAKPALDKCRSWGLDRDHCLAKRLVKNGEYSEDNSAYLDS